MQSYITHIYDVQGRNFCFLEETKLEIVVYPNLASRNVIINNDDVQRKKKTKKKQKKRKHKLLLWPNPVNM